MISDKFIPVNTPLIGGRELELVTECITTGWISSEGPFVAEFEKKMSSCVDRQYGIAVANGSAALDIAVAALGLGKGDEVILPAHTIISCAAAVVRAAATPVLVDSELYTWNMDVTKIEEKISSKTKAIMAVHLYGLPTDMDPILELAGKYGLYVIEDAAEMIGQKYKGRPCGSFGDVSTFSFYPNKHITTGEGGMCLVNSEALADRCRSLRNLCFQSHRRFVHEELGWNYRMTNLQAALGLAQLERLDDHVSKKRHIGDKYQKLLSGLKGASLPVPHVSYGENIYWVFGILLSSDLPIQANEVISAMASQNIGCRPFFWPMHEQPVFEKMGLFVNEEYPNASNLARYGFYIPSGLALTDDQLDTVSETLVGILNESV